MRGCKVSHTFAAMNAAEEVQAIMVRRKWNAFDLSKRAGVPASTITRILQGSDPKHSTMEKIRAAGKSKSRK